MTSLLAGRTLCIVGGNGFVGSAVAQQAVNLGAKVYAVSRSGKTNVKAQWVDKVNWVKGDSLHPETFKDVLKESDTVVHSIGILLDSSVTQFKKPGEEGTYEHMNRDTAIAVGNAFNEFGEKKSFVYVSGSKSPPFLPRYLTTKIQAENHLLNLPNLRTTILKPGFISSNEVPLKKLLSYPVGIYAHTTRFLRQIVGPDTGLDNLLQKIEVDTAVDVRAVAISAIISGFDPKFAGKFLYNEDMETIKERFLERGYEFPPRSN